MIKEKVIVKKRILKGKVLFESLLAKRNHIYKKELRKKATESEKIVLGIFKELKLKHYFQKGFYKLSGQFKGYHCIVDFYITSLHLALEIDGDYHDTPEQMKKDWFKDDWLKKRRKIRVLRIRNEDADKVIEKINEYIYNPKTRRGKRHCNFNYWEKRCKNYLKENE